MEILNDSILKHETDRKITVSAGFRDQLWGEATKVRGDGRSTLLTPPPPRLWEAAKSLRNNEEIIVRKADKCNMFVVMDMDEYKSKLDSILSDTTKFEIVNCDPVNLKVEVNNIIQSMNRECKKRVLELLIGEFFHGYLYGTVKNHKANNPLRPIISQIPTPTHSVAKQINKIITPYLPTKYMLSSTDYFLAILRDTNPEALICSLYVESLFTNVPVTDTINIICDYCYRTHDMSPPPSSMRRSSVGC